MKKTLFTAFTVFMLGVLFLFVSSARVSAVTPTYIQDTDPTASQIISEVCQHNGLSIHDWDYYILSSTTTTDNFGTKSRYFTCCLVQPESNSDIRILNDNYDVNHIAQPFRVYSDDTDLKGVFFSNFSVVVPQNQDPILSFSYNNWFNLSNNEQLGTVEAQLLYASNMRVLVGDVNVNEHLYNCDIFYTSDTSSIIFQVDNISDDTTLSFLYGIRDYQTINGGSIIPDDTSYSTMDALAFLQWCTANKLNYNDYTAFIDVYRGIEFLGSYTVNIGDLIDGGDDFYDHELPLPEAPDYSDYIDDPPEMPSMPDLPEKPDFDPEHPLDSIVNFIIWVGELLLTPIVYIGTLLGWIIETIGYYLGGLLHYLLDLFAWLIESLGVYIYNLVVKLKGLLYKLFVPSGVFLDNIIVNHFPFVNDIKHIFTDITFSGATGFSLTLLNHTYYFSFINTFGFTFCQTVSVFTSVYVDCTCIFICYKAIKGLLNFAQ